MGRRARRFLLRLALFSAGRRERQPFPARTCRAPTTQRIPAASFPANRCFAAYIPPSPYTGELSKHSPSPRRCPSAPTPVPLKLEHGGTSSPTRDRRFHWPHTCSL